jgi:uncharacterized phiE125 gp8 family phage protein
VYGLRRTSVLPSPALDIEQVKTHLSVWDNSFDTFIQDLIPAAAAAAENATHRQLITATFELVLDRFPCNGQPLYLPRPPLQELTLVAYIDTDGATQTWEEENYLVLATKEPAEVWPAVGQVWPATQRRAGAVVATFTAGHGDDTGSVPEQLRIAMRMLIGHWFVNREAVVANPSTVGALEVPLGAREIFTEYDVGDGFHEYAT